MDRCSLHGEPILSSGGCRLCSPFYAGLRGPMPPTSHPATMTDVAREAFDAASAARQARQRDRERRALELLRDYLAAGRSIGLVNLLRRARALLAEDDADRAGKAEA